MAIDEALLEAAPRLGDPMLRFYGWSEPAATFGYSQKYEEVAQWTKLRPLIRRPTGGGLVPHDTDWTYSLTVPAGHAWYSLTAQESYHRVHEWLHEAFAKIGVTTEVSSNCHKELPGQCFAGAEQFDLLLDGRKIAGAAQRRTRTGLLIQGSVQPPSQVNRIEWEKAVCAAASARYGVEWIHFIFVKELQRRVGDLGKEKYSQDSHNQKR